MLLNLLSYIDPGSTALVWQILAGVLIAFGVVLGIWWTKISTFFKSVWARLFGKKKGIKTEGDAADELLDEVSDDAQGSTAAAVDAEVAAVAAEDKDNSDKSDKISA